MVSSQQRDAHIFSRLLPWFKSDYEFLRYSNDRSIKDAFLSGTLEEPDLVYDDARQLDCRAILDGIDAVDDDPVVQGDALVRRAYQPKLAELRGVYRLLAATARGDDRAVAERSVALYGRPDVRYYQYALRELHTRLLRVQDEEQDVRVQSARTQLCEMVQHHEEQYPWDDITLPPVAGGDQEGALSASEIKILCRNAFSQYGVTGWSAVVDAPGERTTFNTNQELRTIFIPSDEDLILRKHPLTQSRVFALLAHEIGGHVVRRERGDRSPLGLLGVGLTGYLRAEEGIATYQEQLHVGTTQFAGCMGYLAVSWAMGLDGTPRTFRGLYEVLVPYLFLSGIETARALRQPLDLDALLVRARRNAWARCVRTFRGTTGRTPGCCLTRDIVYLEGNIAILELVTNNPSWIEHFSLGKYDPTNAEHVSILMELGLLVD